MYFRAAVCQTQTLPKGWEEYATEMEDRRIHHWRRDRRKGSSWVTIHCLGECVISVSSQIIFLQLQRLLSSLIHPLVNFCVKSKCRNKEATLVCRQSQQERTMGTPILITMWRAGWGPHTHQPPTSKISFCPLAELYWEVTHAVTDVFNFNWLNLPLYPKPAPPPKKKTDQKSFLPALNLPKVAATLLQGQALPSCPCGWAFRSHFPAKARNHVSQDTWRWMSLTKFAAYLKSRRRSGHLSLSSQLLLIHQRLICVPLMWAASIFPMNHGRLNVINGPKRHSWKCTNSPSWDHPAFPFKYQLLTVLANVYVLYKLGDLF